MNKSLAVIFPTMNNMAEIEDHLAHANKFLHLADEIIVIDSSDDATPEICRSLLPERAKIIKHPPGLYESWNHAIKTVTSEFTYISTVRDSIDPAFLEKMLNLCAANSIDLLISPPRFIDAEKNKTWPIHQIISKRKLKEFTVFEPEEANILNFECLAEYGFCSLSGSFASNLTRTDILKNHPFPTQYGSYGDFMWFSEICPKIRIGILPQIGSTFTTHDSPHRKCSHEEMRNIWRQATMIQLGAIKFNHSEDLFKKAVQYHDFKFKLKEMRRCGSKSLINRLHITCLSLIKKFIHYRMNIDLKKLG